MFEPTCQKACTTCFILKSLDQFYRCSGILRGECKECVIKKNIANQHKTKPWRNNKIDKEKRRKYQREYYANNKQRFAKYRSDFKDRHPNYYKEYYAL